MRSLLAALALSLPLVAGTPQDAAAQSREETEFVTALLTNLNPLSIEFNREICGFVVRRPGGELESTKVSWGTEATCASSPVPPGYEVLSSWHTHAAWGRGYDGEVPSTIDVEGDMRLGVNGWVSTPGGRLWFVNGQTGDTHQVCGRDCLPADPNFFPEEHGPVEKRYTLQALRLRFGER